MSGFRSAQGGSQSLYDIDPDITCLGKVIGGGLPVAAYGGKREIMQMVSPAGPMYQAGTLSGNPLAMAAGIAALTYMEQNDVCNRAESLCAILTGGLEKAAAKAGVPVQIHRLGSMFTVFFNNKPVTDLTVLQPAIWKPSKSTSIPCWSRVSICLLPSSKQTSFPLLTIPRICKRLLMLRKLPLLKLPKQEITAKAL